MTATAEIAARAPGLIANDAMVVTHCWGPGCNGATLTFPTLGFRVKEMIGGYEYWVREGFQLESADGTQTQPPDPLTAPVSGITCGC